MNWCSLFYWSLFKIYFNSFVLISKKYLSDVSSIKLLPKNSLSPGKFTFSLREYILDCTSISSLDIDISFDNCFDNFHSLAYFQKWWMSFDSLNLLLESWIQKNALTLFIVKMALSKKRRLESSGTFSQDHFSTC